MRYSVDPDWERRILAANQQRYEATRAAYQRADLELGYRVASLSALYPTMSPGLVYGLAATGADPTSAAVSTIALKEAEQNAAQRSVGWLGENIVDPIYSGIKGGVRTAFTGFQSAWEELLARPVRTLTGMYQGMGAGEAYEAAGESAGSRAFGQIVSGEGGDINLGSGFFPNSDVATPDDPNVQRLVAQGIPTALAVEQVQARYGRPLSLEAQQAAEQIQITSRFGQKTPVSLGRLASNNIVEPGTVPFNLMSGTIDFGTQVFLDPSNKGLKTFGAARGLTRGFGTLDNAAALRASKFLPNVPVVGHRAIVNGLRKTVLSQSANQWLSKDVGQWTARQFADIDDLGTIRNILKGSNPNRQIPNRILVELQEATTPERVTDILRRELGVTIRQKPVPAGVLPSILDVRSPAQRINAGVERAIRTARQQPTGAATRGMGGFSATFQHNMEGTFLGRMFSDMGARQINVRNMSRGLDDIDAFLNSAGYSPEDASEWMGRYARVVDGDVEAAYGLTEELMADFGRRLVDEGIDPDIARTASQMFPESVDELRKYFVNAIGDSEQASWLTTELLDSGSWRKLPTPQLITEYLDSAIPLPDPRKVRRALSRTQALPFAKITSNKALEARVGFALIDKAMTKVWKPMVLLRPAFTVRVIAEEQARMAGSGLESAFRHPASWLAWATGRRGAGSVLGNTMDELVETRRGRKAVNQIARVTDEKDVLNVLNNTLGINIDTVPPGAARKFAKASTPDDVVKVLLDDPTLRAGGISDLDLAYDFQQSMNDTAEIFDRPHGSHKWTAVSKGSKHYTEGWATELNQLWSDPLARYIAANGSNDALLLIRSSTDEFADDLAAGADVIARKAWDDYIAGSRSAKATFYDEAGNLNEAKAIDMLGSIEARIHLKTGGKYHHWDEAGQVWKRQDGSIIPPDVAPDPPVGGRNWSMVEQGNQDLIDAIATGRITTRKPPKVKFDKATGRWRVGNGKADHATKKLAERVARERTSSFDVTGRLTRNQFRRIQNELDTKFTDVGPDRVKSALPADTSSWDRMIDNAFSFLMGERTNQLSRAPAFKQFYWKRVAELTPYMDDATRAHVIKMAEASGLSPDAFRDITKAALKGHADDAIHQAGFTGGNILTGAEDVDDIAKAFALEETKDLLYDLSRRRDVTDITRNIFPFAEAWSEILTRWFRIMRENPDTMRRFQQTIEGARGSGFFYENEYGDEVFAFPGGGLLASGVFNALGGGAGPANMSVKFEGRVGGLNMAAGSFMPGFGPAVTMPAAAVLPDDKAFNGLREMLFPFGAPDTGGPGAAIESLLPSWAQKLMTASWNNDPEMSRLFANTVTDVFNQMNLTGNISGTDPASIAKDWQKAKELATNLWWIRGFAQAVGPTGPSVKLEVEDKTGAWWGLSALSDKYNDMLDAEKGNDAAALGLFTDEFGFDPLGTMGLVTSKSERIRPSATTATGATMEQANPELFAAFPDTAYFVSPDDPYEDFDYQAFVDQFQSGDRRDLTDEEWLASRNDMLGRIAYENAQMKVLDKEGEVRTDEAAKQWLREVRYALVQKHPGYQTGIAKPGRRSTRADKINELERWSTSEAISATDAGKAVNTYMEKRAEVIRLAIARGHVNTEEGTFTAESSDYLREWLLSIGYAIAAKVPSFDAVWQDVLMPELRIDPEDITDILGYDISRNPDADAVDSFKESE